MSSFDPFGVYSRRPYYNRKAQINRKKPVFHGGSVSTADLPYLEKKIKALGYKIDYGTTPVPPGPPADLNISEVIHSNINLIAEENSSIVSITQPEIRTGILQTQLFSLLPDPPTSFEVIENIDWIGIEVRGSLTGTNTHQLMVSCPHFSHSFGPYYDQEYGIYVYPNYIGTEKISSTQVIFCQAESDPLNYRLPDSLTLNKTISEDNNSYTIGTKIYSGIEYYNRFKDNQLDGLDNLITLDCHTIPFGTFPAPNQIVLSGVMTIEIKYTL